MKKLATTLILSIGFIGYSNAGTSLAQQCTDYNVTYLKGKTIKSITISSIWKSINTSELEAALNVEVDNTWYVLALSNNARRMASLAQTAVTTKQKVDLCVDTNGGYLVGITLY